MSHISENSLLLTLLCWINERQPVCSDLRGIDVYRELANDVLGCDPDSGSVDLVRAAELTLIVGEIAWKWFISTSAKRPMTPSQILGWMSSSSEMPLPLGVRPFDAAKLSARQKSRLLFNELQRKRVLISLDSRRGQLVFPHRSITEYFAAQGLAVELLNRQVTIYKLTGKSCDPAWHEVIVNAANALISVDSEKGPSLAAQLVVALAEPDGDDIYRHRLALALRCQAAIPAQWRRHELTDQITKDFYSLYNALINNGRERLIPHLVSVGPSAVELDGKVSTGKALSATLLDSVLGGSSSTFAYHASVALRSSRSPAYSGHIKVLLSLLSCAIDGCYYYGRSQRFRSAVDDALQYCGRNQGIKAAVLQTFSSLIRSSEPAVRFALVCGLSRFAECYFDADVEKLMIEVLLEQSGEATFMLHSAMQKNCKALINHRAFETALVSMLRDDNPLQRSKAISALSTIGLPARRFLPLLLAAVDDSDQAVRIQALRSLSSVGRETDQRADFIEVCITKVKSGQDPGTRHAACHVLPELCITYPESCDVRDVLIELMHDEELRHTAISDLSRIRHPLLVEEIVDLLFSLLLETDSCSTACYGLGRLAEHKILRAEIVERLIKIAKSDTDSQNRLAAFRSLTKVLPSVESLREPISALILSILHADFAHPSFGRIGESLRFLPAKEQEKIADLLLARLTDGGFCSRTEQVSKALKLLGRVRVPTRSTEIVRNLIAFLDAKSDQKLLQSVAIDSLASLQNAGYWFFLSEEGPLTKLITELDKSWASANSQ